MDTSRIITTEYGDVYPNVWDDFAWVAEHRNQLLEQYGECVILVYHKKVVGVGKNHLEAAEDAEKNLSPEIERITPIIYHLNYPGVHAFLRATQNEEIAEQ